MESIPLKRRVFAIWASALLWMTGIHFTQAQDVGSSSSSINFIAGDSSNSGDNSSSSSGSNDIEVDSDVVAWLENYLDEGESRLFANDIKTLWGTGIGSTLTANWKALPTVCDGMPSIQYKSSAITPNGACPDVYTNANVSCTCLYGYNGSTEWEFIVQPKLNDSQPPLIQYTGDILEVDSVVTIIAPDNLTKLRFIGVGDTPIQLPVTADSTGWTDLESTTNPALIKTDTNLVLTTVEVENIDLDAAISQTGLLPLTLTSISARNCNISTMTPSFLLGFASLTNLDLSMNNLIGGYTRISPNMCTANPCPMQSINLTGNKITQFPYRLLYLNQLNSLYVGDNLVKNFTMDNDLFEKIDALTNFEYDVPDNSYNCSNGTWKTTHDTKFCIVSYAAGSAKTTTSSSSSNSYLVYVVIGGCFLIAVLLFVVSRHRRRRQNKEETESTFDHTLSFESQLVPDSSMLNDPLIVTNRIPWKEVKVANCISKGGFGLVYSGVYQRRRVAIKRIRSDLSSDMKHIEAFLKEICLMATLNHPRIVEFVGVTWDTLRNLSAVTEYMDRGDLREVLHSYSLRNCRLTWETHKTRIALHIAEALMYMHSLNPKLIHRDLKSKNVLLNTDMDAKLSDFGVSRERKFVETHMTAGIGTSFWIAPEVLLGKDYDERADIFSFGIVMSEIDTDDYPYWNANNPPKGGKVEETAILRLVASGELVPDFRDDCPKTILDLSISCLHVDPDQRPSAAEVVYTLRQLMRASFTQISPVSSSSLLSL